jgi:hypothetical protein
VAVAVEEVPHVVLDDAYRIVEVSPAAEAGFAHLRGESVLDCFPGSSPLFLPYYENARSTGEIQEFVQYYDGFVVQLKVVPRGSELTVFWKTLCTLDLVTIEGLRASLEDALTRLEAVEGELRRERLRSFLRVVEGAE